MKGDNPLPTSSKSVKLLASQQRFLGERSLSVANKHSFIPVKRNLVTYYRRACRGNRTGTPVTYPRSCRRVPNWAKPYGTHADPELTRDRRTWGLLLAAAAVFLPKRSSRQRNACIFFTNIIVRDRCAYDFRIWCRTCDRKMSRPGCRGQSGGRVRAGSPPRKGYTCCNVEQRENKKSTGYRERESCLLRRPSPILV